MYCSDNDVRHCNVGLRYDGEDRTRGAVLIMLCLVVYDNPRCMGRWDGRHLRLREVRLGIIARLKPDHCGGYG